MCFVFNGGPGSSSIWLHLGALGPKRVVIREDGTMPPPPYTVTDNQESWFEHFDLVFIDPPHTGYSITASDDARKKMLSVDGDVDALAECIRAGSGGTGAGARRCTSPARATAPRAAPRSPTSCRTSGVALSGLILVSCAMDLQSIVFAPRNDLPYALFLPAFACVAQYHGKLEGRARQVARSGARRGGAFVAEDYLRALHAGARLSKRARRRVAKRVAELTGLAPALVEEKNLRISDHTFFFELLRDRGQIVGRLEARVTGPMAASRTRDWEFDPGHRGDRRALHDGGARLHERDARRRYAGALRGAVDGRAQAMELEPRRGRRATATPARAPICRARCAAIRTCACWSRAATTTSGRRTARPTGRSRSSTCRPTCWRASSITTTTPGHMMYTREADMMKLKRDLAAWLSA